MIVDIRHKTDSGLGEPSRRHPCSPDCARDPHLPCSNPFKHPLGIDEGDAAGWRYLFVSKYFLLLTAQIRSRLSPPLFSGPHRASFPSLPAADYCRFPLPMRLSYRITSRVIGLRATASRWREGLLLHHTLSRSALSPVGLHRRDPCGSYAPARVNREETFTWPPA